MVKQVCYRKCIALLIAIACCAHSAQAQLLPISTDAATQESNPSTPEDLEKLLAEAQQLFMDRRPIDARTKLLKALRIAPKDYRPHLLLGHYYLREVGHFRLADRYLRTAEKHFNKQYGSDKDHTLNPQMWQKHARLLYLLSESRLNLDKYDEALEFLDRFGALYWDDWYPGTRAWVLMKLKRLDEAIKTAQAGLLRGAEPGRTYNILGILLSLKGSRRVALDAFAQAIRAEAALGAFGQPATPLNNSGEVYRELFQDDLAEASWLKAIQMPDGCEHILPSLNLAMLYIDEMRLFQAERVLNDFEACFSSQSIRSDTEHRSLLSLARGKIALLSGSVSDARDYLSSALEREQWFGKIGTNENDLRFASTVILADVLEAHAAQIEDRVSASLADSIRNSLEAPWLRVRAWWHRKRAREIALDELNDFEDLYIRNTDAMVQYPLLGRALSGFPLRSFRARIERIKKKDTRPAAQTFYDLYLAMNLFEQGEEREAEKLFARVARKLRTIDRLATLEAQTHLARVQEERRNSLWGSWSDEDEAKLRQLKEQIFSTLPSAIRNSDLRFPVRFEQEAASSVGADLLSDLGKELLSQRFEKNTANARFTLQLRANDQNESGIPVRIALIDRQSNRAVAQVSKSVSDEETLAALANEFLDKTFRHLADAPASPLPELELLQGVL